ncbi:LysE family transporter [Paenibacillus turpanensis]|uniref:LysE family transporter n=1 Tax=Paenibacillus turpanensis TaxID=2689078 RepID=UPI00140BCEB7|nr:LysE family transporter [Paenibacillus turpanensis]
MSIFVSYILLGLSLAAPIGPVNAAQLDKGIRFGFWHAWLVGLGAMVADAIFMLLIYFGCAHFLSTPFMKTFLWSFGCFVLLYCGIDSIRNANGIMTRGGDGPESPIRSFSSGFFMTLTNPLSILFWLGIYGSILAKTAESYATKDLLLYSSGIFIGLFLWDVTMALVASLFSRFIRRGALVFITKLAGLSLIGFGVYFGWEAIKLMASRVSYDLPYFSSIFSA